MMQSSAPTSTLVRYLAALASCVLICIVSLSIANGSVARASDPSASAGTEAATPTTSSSSVTPGSAPFSLTVIPTRLVVGPTDVGVTQRIQVVNGGQDPLAVTVQKQNFVGRADGTLDFQPDAPYAASDWVTVAPMQFVVAPGATQIVTADITVPASPEPGDHQVALVFLVPAGKSADNVNINRGVAIPAYITVPGPIDDSVALSDLRADGFATGGPVTIRAQIHNTGTVHHDFRGDAPLRVTGSGTSAVFPDFTVVRDSTRDISTTWSPPLMCICHPTVSVIGADGVVQTMSIRVIVFPLLPFGIVVASLVLVAGAFWLLRRRYRSHVLQAAALLHPPLPAGLLGAGDG